MSFFERPIVFFYFLFGVKEFFGGGESGGPPKDFVSEDSGVVAFCCHLLAVCVYLA